MAASQALHAAGGFVVKVSADGTTYSDLAEVVDATPPEWLVKEAKATHNASPDNMTETKPGIGDTGKGMLTLNFTQAQFGDLLDLFRSEQYWRIVFPLAQGQSTAARIDWKGYWSKLASQKLDPEDSNVIQATVEITRTSGRPTFTEGS